MSRVITLKPASYLQDMHRLNNSVRKASGNLYNWKKRKIENLNEEFPVIEFKDLIDEVDRIRITAIPKFTEWISIEDLAKLEKITGLIFAGLKPARREGVYLYFKQEEE